MRLIPVLDILNGVVVRGVAGNRSQYRPIESCLTPSTDPLEIACAIRERYGFREFYVADLDAIISGKCGESLYRELAATGVELLIDAGICNPLLAQSALAAGAAKVIVGLESCPSPALLREIVSALHAKQVIFSLDLKQGVPVASPEWGTEPRQIAALAVDVGVTEMIVLDVAGVGIGQGVPTLPLCRQLREEFGPELQIITGGGVRGQPDLDELESAGVNGGLVASMLHQRESSLQIGSQAKWVL